jgi:seryl-tRNA synthetase
MDEPVKFASVPQMEKLEAEITRLTAELKEAMNDYQDLGRLLDEECEKTERLTADINQLRAANDAAHAACDAEQRRADKAEAELAEAREIIDRLRPCKVCKGSGDHKTDEQRWGKPSRDNCRHCHGFGYVLTGNRAKFRAAIDDAGSD